MLKRFKSLGANVLFVFPESAHVEGRAVGASQTLIMEDIDFLLRELPNDIEKVAPEAIGITTVKRFQKSYDGAMVIATSQAYFEIHQFKPQYGRVFAKSDSDSPDSAVALLGNKVAEKLFGGAEAVGQTVKVGGDRPTACSACSRNAGASAL